MVDVVLETPEDPIELADGQIAIEHEFTEHDATGEPLLTITARGEGLMALDAEAQDGINAAIAFHGHMAKLRATQPTHAVHVEPEFRTERVRTYDPTRGDQVKPDGEDVTPASKLTRIVGDAIEVVEVPEVRTPYWGFDETTQSNRPEDCPDCTRGLVGDHGAVGLYLRCVQAVVKPDVAVCHAGCVLACGMPA